MRVPTESLDHGHDFCGAQAAGNWAEGRSVPLHVLRRPPERVQYRWRHPPMAGTHSPRSTTADDSIHPTIPRWDESLCAT